jgi:hypothetical protein
MRTAGSSDIQYVNRLLMSSGSRGARRFCLSEDSLPIVLLLVAMAALVCLTPAQNDTWWHLRSGREILATRSFLTIERFSHSSFGTELQIHYWLSQVIFYVAFMIGGPLLLTVLCGTFAFGAVCGAWRLVRGAFETRIILLLFLMIATAPEWAVRPQVISMALFTVMLYLIVHDRMVWLPVVCLVWANVHAVVVLGLMVVGVAVLEALVWSRAKLARDVAVLVGCALAPMVSPLGLHYWPRIITTVAVSQELDLQEYRPPFELVDFPFWAMVLAICVATYLRRHWLTALSRSDRILLLSSGVLALACLGAARNIAFFALVAAPALATLVPQGQRTSERRRAAPWPAYAMLVAAIAGAILAVNWRWRDGGLQLGWRPLSSGVLQAVRDCGDPIFNPMHAGGPLMWSLSGRRIFIDSRMDAYPKDLLARSRRADLFGDYHDLFREFKFNCALVNTTSLMHNRLLNDSSMRIAYTDPEYTVFVSRRTESAVVESLVERH